MLMRSGENIGNLWRQVSEVSVAAQASGALKPLATTLTIQNTGGYSFQVRELQNLAQKPASGRVKIPANPFLPYEQALFVTDVGADHVALLNKYNVVEKHLLLITRGYEPQDQMLREQDFVAASRLMGGCPSLLFFNGGRLAGGSQPHRHLQLVPLPLSDDDGGFPLAKAWRNKRLPVVHSYTRINTSDWQTRASQWFEAYQQGLLEHDLHRIDGPTLHPYNLLATSDEFMMVPRRCECWQGMSVNALAFAGLLLTRNRQETEQIKRGDPFELLAAVGYPTTETKSY